MNTFMLIFLMFTAGLVWGFVVGALFLAFKSPDKQMMLQIPRMIRTVGGKKVPKVPGQDKRE
jgi:hypothetical protein